MTGLVVLSAVGDISRFPSAKKLVGYAGLGARIHASGLSFRTGGITKQGRKELRAALVEAAWITVRFDPAWREQFERLAQRIGRRKAIVAIARKPCPEPVEGCWSSSGTSYIIAGLIARLIRNGSSATFWPGVVRPGSFPGSV